MKGVLFLAAAATKAMTAGGAVVNVTSLGGVRPPFTGLAAYHEAMARPARRMGYADDVATVIVFLASPAARFVTGQLLIVDGGYFYA